MFFDALINKKASYFSCRCNTSPKLQQLEEKKYAEYTSQGLYGGKVPEYCIRLLPFNLLRIIRTRHPYITRMTVVLSGCSR
jgi:hypothetical protein